MILHARRWLVPATSSLVCTACTDIPGCIVFFHQAGILADGRPDHLARRFTRNAIEEGPGEGGALGLQSDQPVLLLLVVLLLVLLSLVVKDGLNALSG
jgi:hypothetical protein